MAGAVGRRRRVLPLSPLFVWQLRGRFVARAAAGVHKQLLNHECVKGVTAHHKVVVGVAVDADSLVVVKAEEVVQ